MMMHKMCGVHKAAWVLLLVGGLNWLLFGAMGKDLFVLLGLGMMHVIAKAVYILVGLSAVAMMFIGKCCMKGCVCHDDKCDHCGPGEMKKDMPMGGMEKKM